MSAGWFSKPVSIAEGVVGEVRTISSARQAVDLLANHWPGAGTAKHNAAYRACLEASHGAGDPEKARAALIEAAEEARILIDWANLTGRQVQLQTKVDPGIIAGAVARIGSTVYDGSVTTQLQKVKERLVNAAAE